MKHLHVVMVGSLPEAAYVDPADAVRARHGKSTESNGPPSEIVMVPLVGSAMLEGVVPGGNNQSSPEMSTLASQVLSRTQGVDSIDGAVVSDILESGSNPDLAWLIQSARSLAASVLSQDETPGNAG